MVELQPTDSICADARSNVRPELQVLLAAPRGFCAGVVRAIDAVRDALAKHGPPVYVRRPIVHNLEVVRSLEAEGAIFVEELDQVPAGAPVIFSAHGVAPGVAADAEARGLTYYDAVCPLVGKVHREVERHHRSGRAVILIGHSGHPEIEGTLGHVRPGAAFILNSAAEVEALPLAADTPAAYAVQTTFSVEDARAIVEALRARFWDLAEPASSDICYATTNRQAAVRALAPRADAVIVVGEGFSSNACRLAELARSACANVQLIANAAAINWGELPRAGTLCVTAAASTPERSVQEVISALNERYVVAVEESSGAIERAIFRRLQLT